MRASELGPLFTSAQTSWTWCSRTSSEQRSVTIRTVSGQQSPVFLINSRTILVTKTYSLLNRKHPSYLRYGANVAEFPKFNYPITPEPIQLGTPFSVLGTINKTLHSFLFRGPWPRQKISPLHTFNLLLIIMILHRSVVFRCARQAHSTLPKTLKTILALPHVFYQYRNMNLFPFRSRRLTKDLRIDLLLAKDQC